MQPQENNNTVLKIVTGFIAIGSILGAVFFYQKSEDEKLRAEEMLRSSNTDNNNITINTNSIPTVSGSDNKNTAPASATRTAEIVNATRTQATVPKAPVSNSKYKDGTYTDIKPYTSPGGADEITISLTLKGDVVTAATFTGVASNKESREYQSSFNRKFKNEVIGKNIDTLDLNAVSGASLTTGAFMRALTDIKSEAKA